MISELPDPLAGDDEQRPLRLHTPARTYSWADWPDLVADLESSAKIRYLILAVTLEEPGENLVRAQAIAASIKTRVAAVEALQDVPK